MSQLICHYAPHLGLTARRLIPCGAGKKKREIEWSIDWNKVDCSRCLKHRPATKPLSSERG